MPDPISYITLVNKLEAFERKRCELEQQKILSIFEYIGLTEHDYKPDECFKWDRILISVPDEDKYMELQQLENFCSSVEFILNKHSDAYFVCDYEDWRKATKGKDQHELQEILKANFGFFSKN